MQVQQTTRTQNLHPAALAVRQRKKPIFGRLKPRNTNKNPNKHQVKPKGFKARAHRRLKADFSRSAGDPPQGASELSRELEIRRQDYDYDCHGPRS